MTAARADPMASATIMTSCLRKPLPYPSTPSNYQPVTAPISWDGFWVSSSAAPRLSVVTSSSRAVGSDATLSLIESRFRGAIAASLDAFFLCESVRDAGGAIVDFKLVELNERGEQFFGRPRSELIEQTVTQIIPSVRDTDFLEQLIDVVETGESFEEEIQVEDDDGNTRWIRHQVVRVDDGVAINSRDITQRKNVEQSLIESEARFRQLVESASDAIYRI